MFRDEIDPLTKYERPPVQCYHGGQSFRYCPNFKCDFSVTTNVSGPPASAIKAAKEQFIDIEHYPDQDAWVPRCHFADYIGFHPNQIRLGNGASEFIDLISRIFKPGTTWRPYPSQVLYLEFERAFTNAGLLKTESSNANAEITVIVNPNSTTGDYIEIDELRKIIAADSKSTFVIDESFIMSYGPDWIKQSAMQLIQEFGDRVMVLTSWTKVWACPLLRLGTLVSSEKMIERIAEIQAPWTVNGFAQSFFIAALQEKDYFKEMWETTPLWNAEMRKLFKEIGCKPNENSPIWVPYVYVDMLTQEIATKAHRLAFDAGLPIRLCDDFHQPAKVRLGVRELKYVHMLFDIYKNDKELMEMIKQAQ